VHHVLVFLEAPEQPGEGAAPGIVKDGFQIGHEGWFAAYAPGYSGVAFPPQTAKRLPAGASLKFQLHYTPNGTASVDQTAIGFVFADEPPEYVIETGAVVATDFIIPPHSKNHAVTAVHRLEQAVTLVALFPHMHLRGKAFRFELHGPDGHRRRLLDVPWWDFHVQDEYWFSEPLERSSQ
jgi:hypothetical protein